MLAVADAVSANAGLTSPLLAVDNHGVYGWLGRGSNGRGGGGGRLPEMPGGRTGWLMGRGLIR